jgi:hypothetical protein
MSGTVFEELRALQLEPFSGGLGAS